MYQLLLLVVLSLVNQGLSGDDGPTVTTPLGSITGYYATSYKGRQYEVYEGVPYAKPPVGDLRFEEPIPVSPWGKLNAVTQKSMCAQYIDVGLDANGKPVTEGSIKGEDDCLYLNINVPVLKDKSKKLPVIFYIHGGCYQFGSKNQFDNKYLADRDVIFVVINYRVGIQGFLSTEDEVLPGNLGLKDQSLALKWVSDNIGYFGGDSNKIILVGQSSGGASVQYHYLSPLSRGLFHGGIAISGAATNSDAYMHHAAEKAKKLGSMFNCPTDDSRRMVDCLKKVPAQTLAAATKEFQYWLYTPGSPFAPVAEKHGARPFIDKSPVELLKAKQVYDVPIVFGLTSDEGCVPVAAYAPHANVMKDLNKNWVSIAPHLLDYNYTLPKDMHEVVATAAKQKYFGDNNIDQRTVPQLTKLISDKFYFIDAYEAVRLQAQAMKSPVYFYLYGYRATRSCSEEQSHNTNDYGVCHGDDVFLFFDHICDSSLARTARDADMADFMMDVWASVADKGKPQVNVEWQPVNPKDSALKYLHISGPGSFSMSSDPDFGQKSFWEKYFKY